MSDAFGAPIQQSRLHEMVAERIRSMIVSESLHPGDRLPSERDLSERLGVSRVVIREATRVLDAQGLVEVKPGSGTYVKELTPGHVSDSIGLFLRLRQSEQPYRDLIEVRRTLEIDIAGLAAERADADDIRAMEAAISGMETHAADPEGFTEFDMAFHAALAQATHNDLYQMLLRPIADLLLEFRRAAYFFDADQAVAGGLKHHGEILDLVKARDVNGARQAMAAHLDQAEKVIQSILRRQAQDGNQER